MRFRWASYQDLKEFCFDLVLQQEQGISVGKIYQLGRVGVEAHTHTYLDLSAYCEDRYWLSFWMTLTTLIGP